MGHPLVFIKNNIHINKIWFIRISLFICTCCLFLTCSTKEKKYDKIVNYWNNKKIVFPELALKYMGKDTICPNILKKDYKILRYIDPIGCTECKLQLFDWRQFILEIESLKLNISCIFVLGAIDFKEFEYMQIKNHFKWPVFYDYHMQFDSLNHFSRIPDFQTFLLDQDNRVILVGDPVKNETMKKLYINTIQND